MVRNDNFGKIQKSQLCIAVKRTSQAESVQPKMLSYCGSMGLLFVQNRVYFTSRAPSAGDLDVVVLAIGVGMATTTELP